MKKLISVVFKDLTQDFIDTLESDIQALLGVQKTLIHWDCGSVSVRFDSRIITAKRLNTLIRTLVASSQVLVLPH